jgi:hypothetical protein
VVNLNVNIDEYWALKFNIHKYSAVNLKVNGKKKQEIKMALSSKW